jgi:hypothetical protein
MQKYIKHCYFKNIRSFCLRGVISFVFIGLSTLVGVAAPINNQSEKPKIEQANEPPLKQRQKIDENFKKVDGFQALGSFKSWEAFSMITLDEVVCWISSENTSVPKDNTDKKSKIKKPSSLMLSIRLENKERDEFSYHSEYNLEPETKLNMTIDKVVGFKLLPQGHWAWLKSSIDESRFVLAAQKGTNLVLSGKTTKDKAFKETYSLSGFTAAYKVAFDACHQSLEKKATPDMSSNTPKDTTTNKKPVTNKKQ